MPYDTATPLKINDEEAYVRFSGPGVKPLDLQTSEKDKVAWVRRIIAELNAPPVKVVTLVVDQPIDFSAGSAQPLTPQQVYEQARSRRSLDAQDVTLGIVSADSPVVEANLQAAAVARAALDDSKA